MKQFYFTNPTDDRHRAKKLQAHIEQRLEGLIKLDNPFYDKNGDPTPEIRSLDRGEKTSLSENDIVEMDVDKIKENDGLIGWITNKTSWGSIQEASITYREMHKPVYLIFDPQTQSTACECGTKNPNNPKHPWAKKHSTRIFGNVEAFVAWAKERYRDENHTSKVINTSSTK